VLLDAQDHGVGRDCDSGSATVVIAVAGFVQESRRQ
jgi:hypothetical protein